MSLQPPLDYVAIGVALTAILAYSLILWFLGRRAKALDALELAVNTLMYIMAIFLLFAITARVCALMGLSGLPDSRQVVEASGVFTKVHELAVNWITRLVQLRLVLAVAPFTFPLSQALYSATGWQRMIFEFTAATYLALAVYAKVLAQLMPLLLPLGSTLTCIPRLRRVGSTLLAAYLSAIPIVVAAAVTSSSISNGSALQPLNVTRVSEEVSRLGPSWNPLTVSDEAARAAWLLADALSRSLVTVSLGAALVSAVSLALGGVYVHLRAPF